MFNFYFFAKFIYIYHIWKYLLAMKPEKNNILNANIIPHNSEISQLWENFRKGDRASYEIIYKEYFFHLQKYGLKICSDREIVNDSLQDLFFDIWETRQNLKATDSIMYYLSASLRRRIIRQMKKNKKFLQSDDIPKMHPLINSSAEDRMISNEIELEQKQKVHKMMKALSKRQRQAIHLKFFSNKENQQISQQMNITLEGVYVTISKALSSLKKKFQK